MRRVEYPPAPMEEMLGQHEEFNGYARMQVLKFRQDEGVSVLPLLSYITTWLVTHEFGLDRTRLPLCLMPSADAPVSLTPLASTPAAVPGAVPRDDSMHQRKLLAAANCEPQNPRVRRSKR